MKLSSILFKQLELIAFLFSSDKETRLQTAELIIGVGRVVDSSIDLKAEFIWVLNIQKFDTL